MPATATPVPAPTLTGQVGLKVDANDLALVNNYLAHRNVERTAKGERKEYVQDHLRPAFDQLVKAAKAWKSKQK